MEQLLQMLTEPPHLLALIACAAGIRMLHEYRRKRRRRLLALCFGAGSGIAVLLLIRMQGGLFGFYPPLSLPYLGSAFFGGIPALLLLWLLDRIRL